MSKIEVTVSVNICDLSGGQTCRRIVTVISDNPLFHAVEAEEAAAVAAKACVDMITTVYGDIRDNATVNEQTRARRYLVVG